MRVDFDSGISAHALEATLHTVGSSRRFPGLDRSFLPHRQNRVNHFRCHSLPLLSLPQTNFPRRPQRRRVADGEEITVNKLAQGRGRGHLHLGHYPAMAWLRSGGRPREQIRYNVLRSSLPDVLKGNVPRQKEEGGLTRGGLLQNILLPNFNSVLAQKNSNRRDPCSFLSTTACIMS